MSTLRLAGRIAALAAAVPAYYVAYLLLAETVPADAVLAAGGASLVIALGATYVALVPDGLGARTVGVSFGGLLLVVAVVTLAAPLFTTLTRFGLGLGVGAVGLVLLFAGASVAETHAV